MKIIDQYHEIVDEIDGIAILNKIEKAGRLCYKSEGNIGEVLDQYNGWTKWQNDSQMIPSSLPFIFKLLHQSQHESVIEHVSITVKFVTNRGVSHELVRHRLMSYSQESTRYCNYSKDKFDNSLTFIKPIWHDLNDGGASKVWEISMQMTEHDYFKLLELGWTPEKARETLPNSLKTEILVTGNLRNWRHILKLRTTKKAHPQIRCLMNSLLKDFQERIPVIFDDIKGEV